MADNIHNYNHPQRYTGEDGKDLIDRFEEGLMPEEQVRGFLRGNVFKYLTRYPDKYGMDDLLKANEYLSPLIAFEDGGDNDDYEDVGKCRSSIQRPLCH